VEGHSAIGSQNVMVGFSVHVVKVIQGEMFREANHNVLAPYGRVTLHVFWELNYDFFCVCV
jgi:hypothetical protein